LTESQGGDFSSKAGFGCAPGKPAAMWVKVPPVELDGSRPKEMSGKRPRG
jgi:hypothetical protein